MKFLAAREVSLRHSGRAQDQYVINGKIKLWTKRNRPMYPEEGNKLKVWRMLGTMTLIFTVTHRYWGEYRNPSDQFRRCQRGGVCFGEEKKKEFVGRMKQISVGKITFRLHRKSKKAADSGFSLYRGVHIGTIPVGPDYNNDRHISRLMKRLRPSPFKWPPVCLLP